MQLGTLFVCPPSLMLEWNTGLQKSPNARSCWLLLPSRSTLCPLPYSISSATFSGLQFFAHVGESESNECSCQQRGHPGRLRASHPPRLQGPLRDSQRELHPLGRTKGGNNYWISTNIRWVFPWNYVFQNAPCVLFGVQPRGAKWEWRKPSLRQEMGWEKKWGCGRRFISCWSTLRGE